jgi:hypothetical protein
MDAVKFLHRIIAIMLLALAATPSTAMAQRLNNRLLNRPYTDLRPWHLGFSVGVHTLDFNFTHNGYVTESGEAWFTEQPDFSPGFCVNGLIDLRLNTYFSLRFSPGMYFGNRTVRMRDDNNDAWERQDIKSNMVVLPVDLKFASLRYRNYRPYLLTGMMATIDVSKSRPREMLQLKSTDFLLSAGFGCDFYMSYFKLCPEVKFCFGLTDVLKHNRPDFNDNPDGLKFTQSLKKVTTQMVVLTFYFE